MEIFKENFKNSLLISTVFGVYYLFVFTATEKIPFPLEISALPTLFVAVGVLSILFSAFLVLYLILPACILLDPLDINYRELIFTGYFNKNKIIFKFLNSFINFLLLSCFAPFFSLLMYLKGVYFADKVMIAIFIIFPFLSTYYVLTSDRSVFNRKESPSIDKTEYWKVYFSFLYLQVFVFVSYFIFITLLSSKAFVGINSDVEFSIGSIIFLFVTYILILPPKKLNAFQEIASKHSKKNFFNDLVKIPGFIVYCFYF